MDEKIIDAIRDERLKHLAVLSYLLNRNSYPLPKGIDYKKAYDDLQDYESYLAEMI